MIRIQRLGYTEYGENQVVSTIKAADGDRPYETAVLDTRYNTSFIVVEAYDTAEEAVKGHDHWVSVMSTNPPASLVENMNGFCGAFKGLGVISYDRKTV